MFYRIPTRPRRLRHRPDQVLLDTSPCNDSQPGMDDVLLPILLPCFRRSDPRKENLMRGYVARKGDRWYAVAYEGLDSVTGRERRGPVAHLRRLPDRPLAAGQEDQPIPDLDSPKALFAPFLNPSVVVSKLTHYRWFRCVRRDRPPDGTTGGPG